LNFQKKKRKKRFLELWFSLIEKWEHFQQAFIDEAVRQRQPRLRACNPTRRTLWVV